ncbi:MAG: DNA translocase FtsK [Oscillospiraceae bacterium]|nr:DNA translocase FtsK [Oscillospiraceae bacterium]
MPAARKPTAKEKAEKTRSGAAVARDIKRRKLWSLVLFCIGILFIVFAFVGDVNAEVKNAADHINTFLRGMFGFSVFFTGPILIYIAVMISMNKGKGSVAAKLVQLSIILLIISAGIQIIFFEGNFDSLFENGIKLEGGGLVSIVFGWILMLFGQITASIIVVLIAFVVFMLASDITLYEFLKIIAKPFRFIGRKIKEKSEQMREDSEHLRLYNEQKKELDKQVEAETKNDKTALLEKEADAELGRRLKFAAIEAAGNSAGGRAPVKPVPDEERHKDFHDELHSYVTGEPKPTKPESQPPSPEELSDEPDGFLKAVGDYIKEKEEKTAQNEQNSQALDGALKTDEKPLQVELFSAKGAKYTLPPISLLDEPEQAKNISDAESELTHNSEILVDTLKSFGVLTKIVGVCRGPSVTRYELQPAEGVKISKITNLVDDIALNLATTGVRIEAPIPNKRAVGIEVPNRIVDIVKIRALIDSDVFRKNKNNKLETVIGRNISGEIVVCDIATMPHILIAGTTGSGKSVCVNDMIMSILFRAAPDEVHFVMIDPKMVEFTVYNGIPHLRFPVVTDAKKAAGTLNWAVKEMLERYKVFAEYSVRDLNGYNSICEGNELEKMPQIVIFIDELADLMMVAPGEVEDSICRLAQMGRAAGIHLVIATQRPSVDVITGIIKANIPSRIALKVASQVDSRTIIDSLGSAEKLLGKGDMLYNPVGAPKPIRVQGCWISEKEIEGTVKFIKESSTPPDYDETAIKEIEENAKLIGLSKSEKKEIMSVEVGELDLSDDKLDEAIDAVIEAGQASTSYLQRKLKLGYGRAARLIDIMEQMGVVGTFEGSKPRQVIMTRQEWLERKINNER